MALNFIPILALAMCGLGVFLILFERGRNLDRLIAERLDQVTAFRFRDSAEVENLSKRWNRWDHMLFGPIKQDAYRIGGTIGSAHVFAFGLGLAAVGAGSFWFGGWHSSVASAAVGLILGHRVVKFVAEHHYRQFLEQFPAYLDRVRKLVEAGNSLDNAMHKARSYAKPRVVGYIDPALRRHELGMPLATALDIQAKLLGISEISQLAFVAHVNARYGGSLRESMAHISQVERDRARANRELLALTAEVRASAKVFVALPLFVAGGIFVVQPSYVSFFVDDPLGPMILAYCGVSIVIGLSLMRRMSRIE